MYRKSDIFAFLLFHCVFNVISSSKDTCGAPFTGAIFEDFHGSHSYQKYEIHQNYLNEDSLTYQVRFRTTRIEGIISQFTSNINEEEILFEIYNGTFGIELIRDTDPKSECQFHLDVEVSDGQCYLVKTVTTKTKLTVELWRQETKINSTQFNFNKCIVGNFSTFLHLEKGGTQHALLAWHEKISPRLLLGKPHVFKNFEGCMGDALVNGIPLVESAEKKISVDVDSSCHHKFSSTCTNICPTSYITDKSGKCRCPYDSKINAVGLCKPSCDCIADKCQNGGSCEVLSESKLSCRCLPGYKGQWCEEKQDPCHDVVCQNGGTCNNTVEPLCSCLSEFKGNRCEIRIDPCSSAPCKNNATCNSTGELFSCICTEDYLGNYCENQLSYNDKGIPSWLIEVVTPVALIVGFGIMFVVIHCSARYKRNRAKNDPENDTEEQSIRNAN